MTVQPTSQPTRALLKESIQDLAHLQRTYDPSDEVFWTYFNARVLLDQPIAVDDFVREAYGAGVPYGQLSVANVE